MTGFFVSDSRVDFLMFALLGNKGSATRNLVQFDYLFRAHTVRAAEG